jgi:hypothetical protein
MLEVRLEHRDSHKRATVPVLEMRRAAADRVAVARRIAMTLPAPKQSRASKPGLQREIFTISRELEYFTADELIKQTGYDRDEWWPMMITKETLDNALDAADPMEQRFARRSGFAERRDSVTRN